MNIRSHFSGKVAVDLCHLLSSVVILWALEPAAEAATAPLYPNIAGSYYAEENYTMDVVDNQLGNKTLTGIGKGTVVLTQSGNRITYKAIDLTTNKINVTRTGTLAGNDLSISGPAAVATAGVTITKNVFTATGTVENGQIVIHGTGTIVAKSGAQIETIQITSTAVLTGDVMPLDVGHIQVFANPTKGGTVSGYKAPGVYPTGTPVTLTAKWAKGYYFVDWTEDDAPAGTDPALPVTVADSHIFKANFAAVGAANYVGLFQNGATPTVQDVGYLSASLTSTSALSVTLRVLGASYTLAGAFDTNWEFKRTIVRAHQSSLVVDLFLDPASRTLSGTVKTADDVFTANVSLIPVPVFTRTSPTPFAGKFTILLPPEAGTANPDTPQGTGYLTMSIVATGSVTATGKLADGTAVLLSGQIADGNTIPLHKYLYVKSAAIYGGIFGNVALHGSGAVDDTCDGALQAVKPLLSGSGYYMGGFDTVLPVQGGRYTPPAKDVRALDLTVVTVSDGGITDLQTITETISVSTTNVVTVTSSNTQKVKVTITASTGAFSGNFINPANGKSTTFSGLLCQDPGNPQGAGFFLGPVISGVGLSGQVLLAP